MNKDLIVGILYVFLGLVLISKSYNEFKVINYKFLVSIIYFVLGGIYAKSFFISRANK